MGSYFITSSGTEIGKTYLTCGLIRELKARGKNAHAIKPIISGWPDMDQEDSDTGQLIQAMGNTLSPSQIDKVSPWRFSAPLSPNMAAEQEGRSISMTKLLEFCRLTSEPVDGHLFIEGVGGIMVPLAPNCTVLDWIEGLNLPLVLVVGTYLGSLSHTLTSMETIRSRGLQVQALVINESESDSVSLQATEHTLRQFLPSTPIFTIPRSPIGHGPTSEHLAPFIAHLDRPI